MFSAKSMVADRDPWAALAVPLAPEAVGVDELGADGGGEPAVLELLVEPPQAERGELAAGSVEPAPDVSRMAPVAAQHAAAHDRDDVVLADHAAVVAQRQHVGPRDGGAGGERHRDLGQPVVERETPASATVSGTNAEVTSTP